MVTFQARRKEMDFSVSIEKAFFGLLFKNDLLINSWNEKNDDPGME